MAVSLFAKLSSIVANLNWYILVWLYVSTDADDLQCTHCSYIYILYAIVILNSVMFTVVEKFSVTEEQGVCESFEFIESTERKTKEGEKLGIRSFESLQNSLLEEANDV